MLRPLSLIAVVVLAACLLGACGSKKGNAIAELTKSDGPIERQEGSAAFKGVKVGQLFFIGDAAQTADKGAELQITNGGPKITMQPHTILRFGGKDGASKIAVELGAIDLSGSGLVGLDVGDVRLREGRVRVTSRGKGASVVLDMGEAQVSDLKGQTFDMVIGAIVDLDADDVTVTTVYDASVPDAPVDAAIDAGVDAPAEARIVVTGKKVEQLLPGEKKWITMTAGELVLAPGTRVRVGKGSGAKVRANGVALDMAGGSSMTLGANLELAVDSGTVHGIVDKGATGSVKIPGGSIELRGQQTGADARLDVTPRDTKISIARGSALLLGGRDGKLEMARGESATLAKSGTIRVVEAIPTYYDLKLTAGESATIHDPRGATAVQFSFGEKCKDGGFIEMDKNNRFQTAKVSSGKTSANIMVKEGGGVYRLRCSAGTGDTAAVASGRIYIVPSAGNQPIPRLNTTNDIDADGRTWRIGYQSVIPIVQVSTKGVGKTFKLHMATGGKDQVFEGTGPKIKVPGTKLEEGTYTYYLERDGVRDPKISTLIIEFDNKTPQVYIQEPNNGKVWTDDVQVRGAVLAMWTAAVGDVVLPIDKQRRFSAKVPKPVGTNTLAIRLSHPRQGVHYYLRRGKAAAP